ncbi:MULTISPECIES: family 16 glycosylhydrolase [Asticcacaulis]|uniref:glycoside hydrolase family 16 protein n=1 Tax=Asticcacaulis TaxID=76890 RepID=UPI001AE25FC8|nr:MULTISPECIES: glycoside hydrolase family 16 protein [Asticcacaulis]MBP2158621.1 beta-glucanase (GH16 family) [Asticcacaulis solisilvae]MDR6799667.1 beta-glucanase (GH16 family) [Asticcacaulis sp. BE141]
MTRHWIIAGAGILTACAGGAVWFAQTEATPAPTTPPSATPGNDYQLVWSDEFDKGILPDPSKWDYDTDRNKAGWWNKEAQYYGFARPENSRIEDGKLIIEARREDLSSFADFGGQKYSSARLITRGRAEWTYGFFDIRAKLPCGRGHWPAIWMLGTGQWPDTGEIDIMESVGFKPTTIYGTAHSRHSVDTQSPKGGEIEIKTLCSAFHNYQLDWRPESLTWLVDGKPFYRLDKPKDADWKTWPYDGPEYLLLNVAIGGAWGGQQGIDDSAFPARMEIDYVRVWQKQ